MCGSIAAPAEPGAAERPQDRHRVPAVPGDATRREPPIVAVEGGPGYPSTGTRIEYLSIFGPLLKTRSLLLVDNRGTGGSALIDCPSVQSFAGRTSGTRVRAPGGAVRDRDRAAATARGASSLFATKYAVDDLAAVLRALEIEEFDLYGDSYGTFFVAGLHRPPPDGLRSVILDSAYPRRDLDPWYVSSGAAVRSRAGDRLARVRRAARRAARAACATSRSGAARATPTAACCRSASRRARSSDLVQDSASDPVILRELDASVRAALAGDNVPLLRLAGQANTWSHTPGEADYFSRGAYLAVACLDYPQLFDLDATPAERRAQLTAQVAPNAFAPFTAAEWVSVSGFTQPYDVCLDWPRADAPAGRACRTRRSTSPILIIGGDLDSLTPIADAPLFAPRLGDNVRIVTVKNTIHVTSQGLDYLGAGARCVRTIIRAFMRTPDAAPNTSCIAAVPPLHTAARLPGDDGRRPAGAARLRARTRARTRGAPPRSPRRRSRTP